MWFVYTELDGIRDFPSEAEAKAEFERILKETREILENPTWSVEDGFLRWGRLSATVYVHEYIGDDGEDETYLEVVNHGPLAEP